MNREVLRPVVVPVRDEAAVPAWISAGRMAPS
jgi:hypothetical protein